MRIEELKTPALLLDEAKLKANIARMASRVAKLGVSFRPHLKTAKSVQVARLAASGPNGPLTVSTLAEARYFFANGFTDILYSVSIAPAKLDEVAAMIGNGANLCVVLDNPVTAAAVGQRAAELGVRFPVMIELDCDGSRAGVAPASAELVEIGRILHDDPGIDLRGVMSHAGSSYQSDTEGARRVAEVERRSSVDSANLLRAAGIPCPVVSVGSTPAALYAETLEGVTELRAGVYMFQDLVMAGIGVCSFDDIAVTVLSSVIGHNSRNERMIIDAGGIAMSKDRGTARQAVDQGFGILADAVTGQPLPHLCIDRASQEHGMVECRHGAMPYSDFPISSRVRVLPNHVCMTSAAYDRFHVVDQAGNVTAIWDRCGGW